MKQKFANQILDALPEAEAQALLPSLELVALPLTRLLYSPGERIRRVYFPQTCVVSIVTRLQDGNSVESGIIGAEGVAGLSLVLGKTASPREATVQLGGTAWVMSAEQFLQALSQYPEFRRLILNYLYVFIAQLSQNSACLAHHQLDQRLARWLLMFADRSKIDSPLHLTQEFIAQMLGVHRPTVSKTANQLQRNGLINYNRGIVAILKREELENQACECYVTLRHLESQNAPDIAK